MGCRSERNPVGLGTSAAASLASSSFLEKAQVSRTKRLLWVLIVRFRRSLYEVLISSGSGLRRTQAAPRRKPLTTNS